MSYKLVKEHNLQSNHNLQLSIQQTCLILDKNHMPSFYSESSRNQT